MPLQPNKGRLGWARRRTLLSVRADRPVLRYTQLDTASAPKGYSLNTRLRAKGSCQCLVARGFCTTTVKCVLFIFSPPYLHTRQKHVALPPRFMSAQSKGGPNGAPASRPRKSWVVLTGASLGHAPRVIGCSQSDDVMKPRWQFTARTLELVCQLSGIGPFAV
jgi:hypothetical protein